jgi:hypothetical protein
MFRVVFWMMEAVRTSETSVDNHFTRQYIPEDNSEHHTRRRENLKSHTVITQSIKWLARNLETGIRSSAGVKYLCFFFHHIGTGREVPPSSDVKGTGVLSPKIMWLA